MNRQLEDAPVVLTVYHVVLMYADGSPTEILNSFLDTDEAIAEMKRLIGPTPATYDFLGNLFRRDKNYGVVPVYIRAHQPIQEKLFEAPK